MATILESIIRGDSYSTEINIKDHLGNVIDITGYKIWFTLRKYRSSQFVTTDTDDSEVILQKIKTTHDNPTQGNTVFNLSSNDTQNLTPAMYDFDVQILDTNLNINSIIGTVQVIADVTRSNS